ncbi:MAG: SAM-dependent methyltransferase [Gammaproteobacteria bacterium]|nr:MAG: SAM-dependent methyltransferase [Gammaproteobacteria bacterium]
MFWYDKNNPLVLFNDIRNENTELCDGRSLVIDPDTNMDFTNLDLPDNSFQIVVFDPPHLVRAGKNSWLAKKYGKLGGNWKDDIRAGFSECFRVLKTNGVLIFKWNETQIQLNQILPLSDEKPLFGHKTGKHMKTHWVCFTKTKASRKLVASN